MSVGHGRDSGAAGMGEGKATGRRLVYVLERFPSDTLNFVYNEITVLEREGWEIDIFSLLEPVLCPSDAEPYRHRTRIVRRGGGGVLLAALGHFVLRRPVTLVRTVLRLLRALEDPTPARAFRTLHQVLVGLRFARLVEERPGHIHAHFAFKAATAALVAAEMIGGTWSFTAHGSAVVHPPSRFSLRAKVRGADFIVAVSDYNRRVMLELCPDVPPERIVVNRTGILLDRFPYREPDVDPGRPLRLVNIASLYPIKNHEGLLRTCAVLRRRGVPFTLDIHGKDEGGRRAVLEQLAADLGVAGHVRFHGVLDHAAVPAVLAEHDVFVLTSHSEGVPVAVMEAMAVGLPVVAPRVTGVPELVEDGVSGFLADPTDEEGFASALARLHGDPGLCRRLSAAGRRKVEQDYDMAANARRLAAVMGRRVAGEPSS